MAGEHVGQGGEGRAVFDAGNEVLCGAQRKAVTADADHAGRRRVDGEQFGVAIEAARIAGVDAAIRRLQGTLALGGPMVPHGAFPPGTERNGVPKLKTADGGIDTGYACRLDRDTKLLAIDAPPAGVISVGGYRFALRAAQDLVAGIEDGSTLAALPDMLAGHRLAGAGADRDAICDALLAHGANPLLVAAFRARKSSQQSSAA